MGEETGRLGRHAQYTTHLGTSHTRCHGPLHRLRARRKLRLLVGGAVDHTMRQGPAARAPLVAGRTDAQECTPVGIPKGMSQVTAPLYAGTRQRRGHTMTPEPTRQTQAVMVAAEPLREGAGLVEDGCRGAATQGPRQQQDTPVGPSCAVCGACVPSSRPLTLPRTRPPQHRHGGLVSLGPPGAGSQWRYATSTSLLRQRMRLTAPSQRRGCGDWGGGSALRPCLLCSHRGIGPLLGQAVPHSRTRGVTRERCRSP
jgi:hypothetical protein